MIFLYLLLLLKIIFVFAGIERNVNLTDFVRHRQKRSLLFEGGGTIKLAIGPIFALEFEDTVPWRSFVCLYNIQGPDYTLPATPIYPWDKWEDTFARSIKKIRTDFNGKYHKDESRLLVYTALESFMNQQNHNGRACLLRSICENAQVDQHLGVFSEILNVVLTPGKGMANDSYMQAYKAGKSYADCLNLYADCPIGASILDQYLDEL